MGVGGNIAPLYSRFRSRLRHIKYKKLFDVAIEIDCLVSGLLRNKMRYEMSAIITITLFLIMARVALPYILINYAEKNQ
jgi:hypothetical protein